MSNIDIYIDIYTGICFIFSGYYVSNRCLKGMVIEQFGHEICLPERSPEDANVLIYKSQGDSVVETLCVINPSHVMDLNVKSGML